MAGSEGNLHPLFNNLVTLYPIIEKQYYFTVQNKTYKFFSALHQVIGDPKPNTDFNHAGIK